MGDPVSAIVGIGASFLGAKAQKDAAESSAAAQERAAQRQIQFMREGRSMVAGYTQPYREAGAESVRAMMGMMGLGGQSYDLTTDPGYRFRTREGERMLKGVMSGTGNLMSGKAMRAALTYGQDMASQEYMNIYQRLAQLTGVGVQGTMMASNAAMGAATTMGDAAMSAGMARGSAYTAIGNAEAGLYSDVASVAQDLPWGKWFGGKTKSQYGGEGYYDPVGGVK